MSTRGKEDVTTYLGHLLTVGLGVERGLSQEDGVFLRSDTQFVVESVMPDFLHIVPIGDDTVFNRVFQGQDTSFRLGLITDVRIFLAHANLHVNRANKQRLSIKNNQRQFSHFIP